MAPAGEIRVLLVEPDPLLGELLSAALTLRDRRFRVHCVADPTAALGALFARDLDVIVTEIEFPTADSSYLPRLRRLATHLALVVLTGAPERAAGLAAEVDAILAKPPDVDRLGRRVQELLERRHSSVVRGFSLESFLQVLELERKTCTLDVDALGAHRGRHGRMWFAAGRLVEARADELAGRDAVFAMLDWGGAVLRLADGCPVPPRLDESVRALLLEFCVARDDAARPSRED